MNEIEKAITYFEALLERLGNGDSDNAVCATALDALREQAERSKGCDHCRGWDKRSGANYCPMCGRRLEVKHDG